MTERGPRWNEITAVFGGAFDPPHLGHVIAVQGLFSNPGVARVLVVPSGHPPLKDVCSPLQSRYKLTELAFVKVPPGAYSGPVELIDDEINRSIQNPNAPSYTFDLLINLKRSTNKIAFVIGADQLEALPRWHRFPELLDLSHWIVLSRKPDGESTAEKTLSEFEISGLLRKSTAAPKLWFRPSSGTFLHVCDTPAPALSSTQLRSEIAKTGKIPEDSLPIAVAEWIREQRLYGVSEVLKPFPTKSKI